MKFSIVCAYRDMGDPARRASFAWTREYWARHFPSAELVVGNPEPFGRAAGLNAAVRAASYDVILQADPDTIVPPTQASLAVEIAGAVDGLVVPYNHYLYLTREATEVLHAGARLDAFGDGDCEFSGAGGHGPVTAFSRTTWLEAHGYDERFGLWGGDDSAFAYACSAFVGPDIRITGSALHSWHPRLDESKPQSFAYKTQFALLSRYRDAAAVGPDEVRALVEARDTEPWDPAEYLTTRSSGDGFTYDG